MSLPTRLPIKRRAALHAALAVLLPVAALSAQSVATAPGNSNGPVAAAAVPAALPKVFVTAGRSTIVTTDFDVTRIAITNPAVADAVVVRPREILVDGK